MKKKHIYILSVTLIVCLFMVNTSYAQGLGDLPGFDTGVDDETPAAPINGLIWLGIAVGSYFGVKKLRE
ncbi:hypothetical protein [Haloflavibacter putidus]|uniref:Uncharacterized protein n=1 Tax=Haloflavibacter putidus TaxID=2576776 RepID=A0A507ZMY1_9FLAO|nr:hypothetical protein [Haloflavibacter putidus]TQD38910.1 hypothetical protein FKR84_08000 [Haloflavibacter putidus]